MMIQVAKGVELAFFAICILEFVCKMEPYLSCVWKPGDILGKYMRLGVSY